jgi:hypothetical protein
MKAVSTTIDFIPLKFLFLYFCANLNVQWCKILNIVSDTCVIESTECGFQFHSKDSLFPFIYLWL